MPGLRDSGSLTTCQRVNGEERRAGLSFYIGTRAASARHGIPSALTPDVQQWYATHGFHPTFYYEAAWNIVGFALLWFVARRLRGWLRDGDIFFMYLIWYPLGRFWVEMFRPDAWRMGSLATAQWVALVSIALGIITLVVNHHRPLRSAAARDGAQLKAQQPGRAD